MPWSQSPPAMLLPLPLGAIASSGRSFMPTVTRSRCPRWRVPWPGVGSSCPSATRQRDASSLGPGALCSSSRRRAAAASGSPTSVSSRRSAAASGGSAAWSTTSPKVSLACPVTTTQTALDAIAALEAARLNADTWLGHSLLEECLHPETGEVLPDCHRHRQRRRLPLGRLRSLHRLPPRVHPRPYPPPLAPDQRRHRALLPGSQVRASLPQ